MPPSGVNWGAVPWPCVFRRLVNLLGTWLVSHASSKQITTKRSIVSHILLSPPHFSSLHSPRRWLIEFAVLQAMRTCTIDGGIAQLAKYGSSLPATGSSVSISSLDSVTNPVPPSKTSTSRLGIFDLSEQSKLSFLLFPIVRVLLFGWEYGSLKWDGKDRLFAGTKVNGIVPFSGALFLVANSFKTFLSRSGVLWSGHWKQATIPSWGTLASSCNPSMFSSGFHVSWYLQWELQIISFSKSGKAAWLGNDVLWQYYRAVHNSTYLWSWCLFMEKSCTGFTKFFHYISKLNSESIGLPKLCMNSVTQSISFLTVVCPWFLPVDIQGSCLLLPGNSANYVCLLLSSPYPCRFLILSRRLCSVSFYPWPLEKEQIEKSGSWL